MTQNKTAEFLLNEHSWNKASLELHDAQPLYGGVSVRLPGWTSSQAFISRFLPGGTETKYRLPLKWTEEEKKQLIRLCVENDFLTIQPEERLGIPDEARPSLTLRNSKGESHTVAKWAGVPDARFEAVYQAVRALAERTEGLQPIKPRFNIWQKGVILVSLLVGILLLGLPAYALAQPLVTGWWPEQFALLVFLLLFLIALLLTTVRSLAVVERRRPKENRSYTHLWVLLIVNLCFSVAAICLMGLGQTAVRLWWLSETFILGDELLSYALVGYTAVFTAALVLLAAGFVMPRLLPLIDERF